MANQIQLINAIAKELTKQGYKNVLPRQYNAIIAAANLVVDEMRKPYAPAIDNMGLEKWLASDDTGSSSLYLAYMNGAPKANFAYPHDPDDFRRCCKFLRAVPEASISKMKDCAQPWGALVENWSELEKLYKEESPTGKCPKLYELMEKIIEEHR